MKKVYCLGCDRAISLHRDASAGDEIVCEYCEAEFELMRLNPPEIVWLYDDDDWDDDEYDNSRDDDWDDDE